MNKKSPLIWNPFQRIAGWQALAWGMAGLLLSTVLSYLASYHYNGLLQFGAPRASSFWVYLGEHLVVWLVPALLFWVFGLIFSQSRIRMIDVLGTVLFAQLPLLAGNVIAFTPPMQQLLHTDLSQSPLELLEQPWMVGVSALGILTMFFMIWMLIWMFQALKTSCNLKGARLWIAYLVGVLGGDILTRIIISCIR